MKRTYTLLIADDEYWVRQKLMALLDWQALGLRCLEPAKDGRETLERVRAQRPDILVTDINMPFLSGVELLRQVRQESPGTVSFVVSGYDDFAYVKGAFLEGGIDYLLKPVSREDMARAVSRAVELLDRRQDPAPAREEPWADTTRSAVRQAAAYIDGHYTEDLTLSGLAEKYRVESSYFSRMFRQELGENLISYITRLRIRQAQEQMARGQTNLTQIAFDVGYNDYSYFNRVFKKHTGMSPREYRNTLGNREDEE